MLVPDREEENKDKDLAEAELQQELRAMFEIDTQKYLQNYLEQVKKLRSPSWKTDIQGLYRSIHTIKGGAVTVGADRILRIATLLEDLLSDLCYLNSPPPLEDGCLKEILLETGELLAGTISPSQSDLNPTIDRVLALHQKIEELYLPEEKEKQQIQQEFAENGLDLVILDLEIAIENLPDSGVVSPETIAMARDLLARLESIGRDIKLASGWQKLLTQARELFARSDNIFWRSNLPKLFAALKSSARSGGELANLNWDFSKQDEDLDLDSSFNWLEDLDLTAIEKEASSYPELDPVDRLLDDEDIDLLTEELDLELEAEAEQNIPPQIVNPPENNELPIEIKTKQNGEVTEINLSINPEEITENKPIKIPLEIEKADEKFEEIYLEIAEKITNIDNEKSERETSDFVAEGADTSQIIKNNLPIEKIQIPVPLERLDRSAEYLIETLLASRSTQNFYNTIHNQLVQLISLAKEGVEQIGDLQKLQEDYALLADRDDLEELNLPNPDRYRQGYNTINRLLEMNLRLSELGSEAERTARQTSDSLSTLEDNILKLQSTVEESRLVPFQNLAFRARIILRDLTNRYGKPAQLIVKGEEIDLEVGVARTLEPALLHLIRNAYAHGLESIEQRLRINKPPEGTIYLTLSRHGNAFQLELQDDGAGIDAAAIQAKAKAKGLPLTDTRAMDTMLSVICQAGFSSSDEASELCGRGMGMDVVKEQIEKIGGKLSLETILGEGTSFRLEFPVPYLFVSCIKVRSSDRYFAIPTENIATTAIFADLEVSKIEEPNYAYSYILEGEIEPKPGFDLLQYWQPSTKFRSFEPTAICIYVPCQTDPNKGIWLLADELLDRSDLSIEPLPHPLIAPIGLMGVSLNSDGTLIPVIEASILGEYLLNYPLKTETTSETEAIEAESISKTILIVDDAVLMRRRIQASLNAYGYSTHACANGREAWNWIATNPNPALIITDIDMPNMDGFTLTSHCRKAGITSPILIISARVAEEWSKEAFRLGATEYITKGFSTSDLINKVKSLLGE